jgi:competence protein ComEC
VLRTKDGHHIVIDTGGDPAAAVLQAELRVLNAQKIDHLILTAPTAEHINGLGLLTQIYPIGRILYPELSAKEFQLQQYESAKTIPRLQLKADDEYRMGNGISLRVFYPRQPIFDTLRDASLVVQLNFKGTRTLFTGDLSKEAMDALLDLPLESDILVVPNHARAGSLTEGFLKKVNPRIAVITGIQKGVQSPDENLVEQLSESWIDSYRTDQFGTVTVIFSNKSFEILGP